MTEEGDVEGPRRHHLIRTHSKHGEDVAANACAASGEAILQFSAVTTIYVDG